MYLNGRNFWSAFRLIQECRDEIVRTSGESFKQDCSSAAHDEEGLTSAILLIEMNLPDENKEFYVGHIRKALVRVAHAMSLVAEFYPKYGACPKRVSELEPALLNLQPHAFPAAAHEEAEYSGVDKKTFFMSELIATISSLQGLTHGGAARFVVHSHMPISPVLPRFGISANPRAAINGLDITISTSDGDPSHSDHGEEDGSAETDSDD